jgi:hypothetical protein
MSKKPFRVDPWDDDGDENPDLFEKIISVVNQPAYVVVMITAILYMAITSYYVSYFERLSIPFNILNVPFTFYLNAGRNILIIIILLIFALTPLILIMTAREYKEEGQKVNYKNLVIEVTFSILLISLLIFDLAPHLQLRDYLFLYIFLSIFLIELYIFYISDVRLSQKGKLFVIGLNLALILFLVAFVPQFMGHEQAINLIDGNGIEVQIQQNDRIMNISNKTLMLITQSDNFIYLIEKNNPDENPKIYVLDRNETKMLILTRHS